MTGYERALKELENDIPDLNLIYESFCSLKEENKLLKECVDFYAYGWQYKQSNDKDGGELARQCLAKIEGNNGEL